MRKIKRRKNYTKYVLIATIGVFSCMGIGYSYLQQTLNLNMSVTKKDQIVDITDDVVTSGDGLYVDSTREERYVYKGTNPNNYIQFNNELWRIVAKEVDGTYKIVKDEPLPSRKFDPMGYRDNGEGGSYCEYGAGNGGCNAWAATNHLIGNPKEFTNTTFSGTVLLDSSLNQYLNGEYLSSITTNKEDIVAHDWGVGATYTEASKNDDGDVDASELVAEENAFQWNGKVALLSSSDLLLSIRDEALCGTQNKYESNTVTCKNNSFLLTTKNGPWWLLSPSIGETAYVHTFAMYTSVSSETYADDTSMIRPALHLDANIILKGGGTKENPYKIYE